MGNRYRRSGGSCSHTTDSDPARSTQRVQGASALSRVLWKGSPTEPKGYFSDLAPSRRCSALAWWHRSLEATEGSSDGADIRDGFLEYNALPRHSRTFVQKQLLRTAHS